MAMSHIGQMISCIATYLYIVTECVGFITCIDLNCIVVGMMSMLTK